MIQLTSIKFKDEARRVVEVVRNHCGARCRYGDGYGVIVLSGVVNSAAFDGKSGDLRGKIEGQNSGRSKGEILRCNCETGHQFCYARGLGILRGIYFN